MAAKYQIFVSSTYEDLKEEREQVIRAILEMGHIPVGMEMFSAGDEEQWKIIARQIDESDYYVLLVAHRYGSVVDGISFTEKEYDHAIRAGIPALGFVVDDEAPWPRDRVDTEEEKLTRLSAFKTKVRRKPVGFWRSRDELHGMVSIALMKQFNTIPRPGWVRASDIVGPEVLTELSRLSGENARLRKELDLARSLAEAEEASKLERTLSALRKHKVNVSFWKLGETGWSPPVALSFMSIFADLAPSLLSEMSATQAAGYIGMAASGLNTNELRANWPVPQNQFAGWMGDLAALDLIQPSTKKHSVSDTNEYWSLTSYGRDVYLRLRRARIEAGLEAPSTVAASISDAAVTVVATHTTGDGAGTA